MIMPPFEDQEGDGTSGEFEWTADNECQLFMAMADTKPAGINKHFHMLEIVEKFSVMQGRDVPPTVIWRRLDTLYDMQMCDEIEGIPFPNEMREFALPDSEFGELMKAKKTPPVVEEIEERAPSPPRSVSSTPRSMSRGVDILLNTTPKVAKKEPTDKPAKERKESESSVSSTRPQTPIVDTPTSSKTSEKEIVKSDPRRDSKDSNASSKEGGSVKGGTTSGSSGNKTPSKEYKGNKALRASIAGSEKSEESSKSSEDPGSNKRGTRRPLRGSLKPEEQPKPPGRRRRI